MQKAYDLLPIGYKLTKEINLEKDKRHFIYVNLLSVVAILPILPLLWFIDFSEIKVLYTVLGFVLFFVIIMIHELIHGYFFHYFSKKKVTYKFHGWAFSASTPNTFYVKPAYLIVGLAPAVIINSVLLVLFFVFKDLRVMFFFILLLHFSGCAGDFYVTFLLRKHPKDTLVEDYGIGMYMFERDQTSNAL